jgi:hypothetical protein
LLSPLVPVDCGGIRERTKGSIIRFAEALQLTLSETAMSIPMQTPALSPRTALAIVPESDNAGSATDREFYQR